MLRDVQEFFALFFGSAYWRYQLYKDDKRRRRGKRCPNPSK